MKIEQVIERLQEIAKIVPGATVRAWDAFSESWTPVDAIIYNDGKSDASNGVNDGDQIVDICAAEAEDQEWISDTDDPGFDPMVLL